MAQIHSISKFSDQENYRLPPHSIEAEQSLLGGLLVNNDAWDQVADLVYESDFYRDDHRRIFSHLRLLIEAGNAADVVTVSESIGKSNETDQTGGLPYLGQIANSTPSATNVRQYAKIIHENAVLRKLIAAGNDIASNALNSAGQEISHLLDSAERSIFDIYESGSQSKFALKPMLESVTSMSTRMEELAEDPSRYFGITTGYDQLDQKTTGLHGGDMIVIAGRPGMGKTAFALNIAAHVGMELHLPVAIFSLEMSGDQLASRFLACDSKINMTKLRRGNLSDQEWARAHPSIEKLKHAPIHIDESSILTPTDLRARARRMHRQFGKLSLIVIDYLQLMTGSSRTNEGRVNEISEISRSIKALAKEINVPILALSQLSRKVEERKENKRPLMSDLRESGAIEQDADIVLMMYREDYYNETTDNKGQVELIIGKHRNGPTGKIDLRFFGEYGRFENAPVPGENYQPYYEDDF